MVIPFHCNPALAVTTVHKLHCKMRERGDRPGRRGCKGWHWERHVACTLGIRLNNEVPLESICRCSV